MRRLLFAILLAFLLVPAVKAQNASGPLTVQGTSANCTTTTSINTSAISLAVSSGATRPTTAAFALAGTYSGTATFYVSANGGATWSTFGVTPSAGGAAVTTSSANGNWSQSVGAYTNFCAVATTFASGSINVTIQLSTSGGGGGGGGSGSGTVGNCGTVDGLAYYPASGTAITCDPNATTDGSGNQATTGSQKVSKAAIGTTPTDAIQLFNPTAAANNAQQYSPSIHWQAQGWKTNATAGSQTLDYISYLSATQGSANPSGTLNFCPQVNGGGYGSNCLTLGSDGLTRSTSLGYWFGIENNQTGNFAILDTAPTVATSGCGTTGASIVSNNGTAAFKVNVGTTNSGTCTITLPAASTDWICSATDITTTSTTVSQTKSVPTGGNLTTKITLQNYTDISGTHAWVDSDVIAVSCMGE